MERRRALAALGATALVSTAGCATDTGRDGDETTLTDETTTPTPTDPEPQRLVAGTPTTVTTGVSLTITDPRVRRSVITSHTSFFTVQRGSGVQFVVVDVQGDTDFDPSSFVLERDGVIQSPPQTRQYVRSVTRRCGGTCIGIPVEVEVAASAAVAYRPDGTVRATWALDDPTVAAFSNVPDVRLRDATLTEVNDDVGITFSVDNVGERDGVFSGLVAPAWASDAGEPVGFVVPRGETVTETVVPSNIRRLDPDSVRFSTTATPDTRYFEIESDS